LLSTNTANGSFLNACAHIKQHVNSRSKNANYSSVYIWKQPLFSAMTTASVACDWHKTNLNHFLLLKKRIGAHRQPPDLASTVKRKVIET
jgi:hypothetical protein